MFPRLYILIFIFLIAPSAFSQTEIERKVVYGSLQYYCKTVFDKDEVPKVYCSPQGLGSRIEYANGKYVVTSTYEDSKAFGIYGDVMLYNSSTFEPLFERGIQNSTDGENPKGFGKGQVAVFGSDFVFGVPYVVKPEVAFLHSNDGAFELKPSLLSPKKNEKASESGLTQMSLEECTKRCDFFGSGVAVMTNSSSDMARLIVSAHSPKETKVYIFDAVTHTLVAEIPVTGLTEMSGEINKIFDLDGDDLEDFAIVGGKKGVGKANFYSSKNGALLLSIRDTSSASQKITSIEVLDDLKGDGVNELAIAFEHHNEGNIIETGRVEIVDGSAILSAARKKVGETGLTAEMFMAHFYGNQKFQYLGATVKRLFDLNDDGVDEFVIAEPGFLTQMDTGDLNMKKIYGRIFIYDGRLMERMEMEAFFPDDGGYFGGQIAVDPIHRTMLVSSQHERSKSGTLYFYRWKKSDPAVQE